MTAIATAPTALAEEAEAFPLTVLKILFFTGFALVATVMSFVFLPVAGVAMAALVAWQGFRGLVWGSYRDFSLRVLSILAFSLFATVATVLAFVFLPAAGFALAALFLWRGFGSRGLARRTEMPAEPAPPTGNRAFDAYRADTLNRLEEERAAFEAFLERLRAAKDMTEFDAFMDGRARAARDISPEA